MLTSLTLSAEEFASARRKAQVDLEVSLALFVSQAYANDEYSQLLEEVAAAFRREYHTETGTIFTGDLSGWTKQIEATLRKSEHPDLHTVNTAALWLATLVLTHVSIQAAVDDESHEVFLEWVDMHDSRVRETHREANGQVRPAGEKFLVGGFEMIGPGDITAPIAEWINCRCALRPTLASAMTAAGGTMNPTVVPWHGVLTVEGQWSGDKRMFAKDALSWRPLPLPLTWQKKSASGHDGNVTVARIDDVWKDPATGEVWGWGESLASVPEAGEWVGLLAEMGRFGVSVDADSAEFDLDEDSGGVVFTDARGCSACTVSIPAFHQAYVALGGLPAEVMAKVKKDRGMADPEEKGEDPAEEKTETPEQEQAEENTEPEDPSDPNEAAEPPPVHVDHIPEEVIKAMPPEVADHIRKIKKAAATGEVIQWRNVPAEERKALVKDGKALPDGSFPIANKDDLQNAIHAIGRAKDPAKAKAHIKKCAESMGATDMLPEGWALDSTFFEQLARGAGWVTNPVATKRIHDYWTVPGQPGYDKIGWGTDGDFNRCRVEIGQEIAEKTPEKLRYINQQCAQWQHDAIGIWPGPHEKASTEGEMAPALRLVAAGGYTEPDRYRAEWFALREFSADDPRVVTDEEGPGVPLTVTPEGQVYGHVARWGSCHIDNPEGLGVCTTPPRSLSGYREFHVHAAHLDDGTVLPVGGITVGGGHASLRDGLRAAREHYDDVSTIAAHVTATEGTMGIWLCGQVTPWATSEQIAMLRSIPVSGDWRADRFGNAEMIAAHAVVTPGFRVPRTKVAAANGHMTALVASTGVHPAVAAAVETERELGDIIAAEMHAILDRREEMERWAAEVAALEGA